MTAVGAEPNLYTKPWFLIKDDKEAQVSEAARALVSQVNIIELSPVETQRRDNLLFDLELYFGSKLQSLYEVSGNATALSRTWEPDSIMFNLCYSITNTIRNRICSFRPRAQFLPNGGDYKASAAARDMTDMCDAWAVETSWQQQASLAFRDRLTGDGGVMKYYKEDGKVKGSRFPAWEFYFDEAESIYGEPECAYHVTYMPLEQAAQKYGISEYLLAAQAVASPAGIIYITNRQMVRIVEAWKRAHGTKPPEEEASEADSTDDGNEDAVEAPEYEAGRHMVTVGEQIVVDEEWEWDDFPLDVGVFDENAVGVWGNGAIRMLRADQLELIKEQEVLRRAHEMASAMVAQVQDAEAGPTKMSNDYVRVERYKNAAAQYVNPPPVHQERYQYIDTIWKRAYDKMGISQFLAAGTSQPGKTSAVAIDASSEMQSDRLALCSQMWESMIVTGAKWWWRFTKELARAGVKPTWKAIQRGVWRELVFEDLDGEYEIRPFPSSLFGQTVSGRLNKAMQAVQAGWIEKDDALQAIDVPDLAPITDLILAPRRYMENLVDNILEKGDYKAPTPYIDPAAMQSYARNRYLLALSDESNYPEEHLALLRRLIDSLSPSPAQAATTPAPAPAGQPMPAPVGATPTGAPLPGIGVAPGASPEAPPGTLPQ